MNTDEIKRLSDISDSLSANLNKAWHGSMTGGNTEDMATGLFWAKRDLQSLNEALLPDEDSMPEHFVTSEVAAQNRANEIKHEMD